MASFCLVYILLFFYVLGRGQKIQHFELVDDNFDVYFTSSIELFIYNGRAYFCSLSSSVIFWGSFQARATNLVGISTQS